MRNRAADRLFVVILTGLTGLFGCRADHRADSAAGGPPGAGPLVVERSRTAGVEHIRTVSGSRWHDATLEEELAIGAESGEEAYLFGNVTAAWATGDAVYVVDAQVPAVRMFDDRGRHLRDIGRAGQGPGEYGWPGGVAVTGDGRVLVADALTARVNVYNTAGELLEDWPLASQKAAQSLVLLHDDTVFTEVWSQPEERMGMRAVGPAGPIGALRFPPLPASLAPPTVAIRLQGKGDFEQQLMLPFAPTWVWTFTPAGRMVAGTGDRYRLAVHDAGRAVMLIERDVPRQPVREGEARFHAVLTATAVRSVAPDFRLAAADVPRHKPAFVGLYADRSHRLWVARDGPGRPDPECRWIDLVPAPRLLSGPGDATVEIGDKPGETRESPAADCWRADRLFDLYDLAEGELLATLAAPQPGFRMPLFAADDLVLAAVVDERGTQRLARYRLRHD